MDRKKILIIDDEKEVCVSTKMLMERVSNYQVETALNGTDGLRLAKKLKPDLIILDVRMPGLSGFDVLRELKNDLSTMEIPVIMLTALNDEESKSTASGLYSELFLNKPISAIELKEKIDEVFKIRGGG
jgi:DNA-binding response OmpR family regulator